MSTEKEILCEIHRREGQLAELKQQYHDKAEPLHADVERLQWALLKAKWGVSKDSRVRLRSGKVFQVIDVEHWWGWDRKPWLKGRLVKKDGTVSPHVLNVYGDWELVP